METEMIILLVAIGIIQLIVLVGLLIILKAKKAQGYPLSDEMSQKMIHKAGIYSFVISWALWMALGFAFPLFPEEIRDVIIFIGLGGMGIIFIIVSLIIQSKGVQ